MSKYTAQQLNESYRKLPDDLKSAIYSIDSADIIAAIGKKYNLAIDKVGELADETGLVMLGLTHPNNFIPNLAERLKVDKENARKIAEDVNSQIFAKVRESLRKIHEIKEEVASPTPQPTTPTFTPAPLPPSPPPPKTEILKEIEKADQVEPNLPEILKGNTRPPSLAEGVAGAANPFEAKTKEIVRIPPEEKRYPGGDPYRESIE